jgi:ATP-binding cassette subfamily B protein
MLGNTYNSALIAMAGAERVFRLLDTPPEWQDQEGARDLTDVRGRVEFRNLTFGYDPENPVLADISFVVEPGQTVALVGHTGSGKTTTVNLAAKFYLPTAGEIYIDDTEIRDIRGDSLHRHMGIVQQQNFLFSGSVLDNIRIGRPEATEDEVREAARTLDCLDLIESLPMGFHTVVGEGGSGISLGQQQLICFTRAMLADPQIFVLDEATSSVDSMTEARIQHSLNTLLKGRTSFVIAHRLSTIRDADQVLVFDHGEIVERGTHTDLLRQGEVYADLYRQFVTSGMDGG